MWPSLMLTSENVSDRGVEERGAQGLLGHLLVHFYAHSIEEASVDFSKANQAQGSSHLVKSPLEWGGKWEGLLLVYRRVDEHSVMLVGES